MKKYFIIALCVFVLLAGSVGFRLIAIQNAEKSKSILEIQRAEGIPVSTTLLHKKSIQETLDLVGTVIPFKEVAVAARRGDEVSSSSLVLGKFCRQDEVVIQLYDQYVLAQLAAAEAGVIQAFNVYEKLRKGTRTQKVLELEAAVKAAESQLNNARKEFDRMQELQKTGSITQQNSDRIVSAKEQAVAGMEAATQRLNLAREGSQSEDILAAKSAYHIALANRDQAKLAVEHSTIKAPFDGFISQIFVEQGEQVGNGKPLFSIVDTSRLFLKLEIPQSYISRLANDQVVKISFDTYPDKLEGKVSEISPNADPVSRTYLVKVLFENRDFRIKPGVFAHSTIILEDKPDALVLPRNAIVERNGEHGVFIIENLKARFQKVQTGIRGNEYIEIVSSLPEKSHVVTMGQMDLTNDSLVSIQNESQTKEVVQ